MELGERITIAIYQALEVVRVKPIEGECAGGEPSILWGLDTDDIKAITKPLVDLILALIEQAGYKSPEEIQTMFNPDYLDFRKGVVAGRELEQGQYEPVQLEVSNLPQIRGELENFAKDVVENYQKTGLVYPSTLGNVARRIATIAKNQVKFGKLYRRKET